VFKFHLTFAIEQANEFYEEKEKQASEAFTSVSKAVAAVAEVFFLAQLIRSSLCISPFPHDL
jgi:hypothetical protein